VTNSLTHGGLLRWRVAQRGELLYTEQRVTYQRFEQVASCSRGELLYTKQRVDYQRFAYQRFEQCAGSDTRPPMLDRTDFESWQQRIRLYCLGKDNRENIMKSIKEGPFHMGTVSDVITGGTEGAVQQGPVRARVLNDLSAEEKERARCSFKPTDVLWNSGPNASVQKYPTQSSESPQSSNQPSIADNFQLDTGSTSTDNLIESLTNTLALLNQSFKAHLPQMNNQLRTSSNARNNATVQDGRVVVQDVRGQNRRWQFESGRTCHQYLMTLWMIWHSNVVHVFDADNAMHDSDVDEASHHHRPLCGRPRQEHVVQSNVSSVRNDALMSILDEMHEQGVQSRSANKQVKVVNDTLTSELARYRNGWGV
ncbi:hypothetical protein Tco_0757281, partial [Tanacetum coccineum]